MNAKVESIYYVLSEFECLVVTGDAIRILYTDPSAGLFLAEYEV
jgi:hypothetical protein